MTDEQFKELIQAIGSVSWHLKRLADLEEEKQRKWLRELELESYKSETNKLRRLLKERG